MKIFDIRLLARAREVSSFLVALVILALLAAGSTVAIAWHLASFVVEVFVNDVPPLEKVSLLFNALGFAGVRAAIQWTQEYLGARVSSGLKVKLREIVLSRIDDDVPVEGSSGWSLLLGPGLDSFDAYFSKFLPQLVFTAVVTPLFIALLFGIDIPSSLVLIFTMPLIPLFMILIGLVTRDLQQQQLSALTGMSNHFGEVVRGILTLKIFNRIEQQTHTLRHVAQSHRRKSIKVLRVSFLSGFALELAASLSVALIAVTIGIRLIDGELDLLTGLFVLLIAPEAYLPLRQVGAQYHASSEAVEVSKRVLNLIDSKQREPGPTRSLPDSGFVVLIGPSGSGKSRAIRSLSNSTAWMPQSTKLLAGTLLENITMFSNLNESALARAMKISRTSDFDLQLELGERSPLSGGERQRVGLARALYRAFSSGVTTLALDEPLSQQSPELVRAITEDLKQLSREGYCLLIATHQKELISASNAVVRFD